MSKVNRTQKIDTFEVSVKNGNFNVSIKGIVGKGAYIALHDKDKKLEYNNYLVYYYLEDFFECKSIEPDESDDFPMLEVSGTNWINYNASSEMRIVIWDSTPNNPTIDAQYICRIPKELEGDIQNGFAPARPPYPPDRAHSQYVLGFHAFLNNSDWNITIEGIFSKQAWIGLYQGGAAPTSTNFTKWDYLTNFTTTIRKAVHRENYILIYYQGSYWFNYRANTNCYFVIWDIRADKHDYDEDSRYTLHIPEVINKIKVERNYN